MLDPECASPQAAPAAPQHQKAEPEGEVAGRRRPQGKKRSGVPRPKVKKHKASADSVYTCSHEGCNYTCSRKDLLIKHESTHVAKLFACNMCAWKFKSQGRLDKHMMNRHSDTSTYGQGRQIRRVDPPESPDEVCREFVPVAASVECEDGPERSARRGLKRTSESKAKSHVCSTCGRVCKTAGDLASHVKTHEPIESRQHFGCTWPGCPRTYLSEFARNQHVRAVHLKEKRFTCGLCSRAFAFKHNLAAHKCSTDAAPEVPAKKKRRITQPLGDASLKRFADKFFVSEQLPATQSLVREDVGCHTSQGDGREDGQAEVDQENVD